MTVPRISVDVAGVLQQLAGVFERAADLRPVLAGPINASVDELFREQFASEGAAFGAPWQQLAPVTLLARARRGHGRGGILRDTNRLWASLTKLGLGPDAVRIVTNSELVRGTTVPYAQYHQTGYTAKTFIVLGKSKEIIPLWRKIPKRIPARPVVPDPLPTSYVQRWEGMITDFIVAGGR